MNVTILCLARYSTILREDTTILRVDTTILRVDTHYTTDRYSTILLLNIYFTKNEELHFL